MKKTSGKTLRYLLVAAFILVGAVCGYLFYRLRGCASGTCPISSSPVVSTLYGGVIGWLIGAAAAPEKKKNRKEEPNHE